MDRRSIQIRSLNWRHDCRLGVFLDHARKSSVYEFNNSRNLIKIFKCGLESKIMSCLGDCVSRNQVYKKLVIPAANDLFQILYLHKDPKDETKLGRLQDEINILGSDSDTGHINVSCDLISHVSNRMRESLNVSPVSEEEIRKQSKRRQEISTWAIDDHKLDHKRLICDYIRGFYSRFENHLGNDCASKFKRVECFHLSELYPNRCRNHISFRCCICLSTILRYFGSFGGEEGESDSDEDFIDKDIESYQIEDLPIFNISYGSLSLSSFLSLVSEHMACKRTNPEFLENRMYKCLSMIEIFQEMDKHWKLQAYREYFFDRASLWDEVHFPTGV